MRGSVAVRAVGTDDASPSPVRHRAPLALDMMRYQRLSPDCFPLGNGGGGPVPRKPASRPSYKDDDAPGVATDGSRHASYPPASSVESKALRARAPQATPLSSAGRSPARDHAHHHPSDSSDPASPSSTGAGGVGDVLLQWGHNKRSRCRRDATATAPSAQRRQPGVGIGGKIQRRASAPAPAEKLMPPPPSAAGSYTRGSNLRSAASFPSRSSAAGDARHGGHHAPHHHHR